MKTNPLQDMALKSFSPSSSSVSYIRKADRTTEVTRPLYFVGDETNLHVKTGVDSFVVWYFFVESTQSTEKLGEKLLSSMSCNGFVFISVLYILFGKKGVRINDMNEVYSDSLLSG